MRDVRALASVLLLLAAALTPVRAAAAGPDFPPLTGRVVDRANMLSTPARATLTAELAAHEAATGQQVVVVTLPTLHGQAIEEYGYQLGRHWAIGRAGHDDGALLIVAEAERQIRIEVGYGLEGTLTDARSWDIIQSRMMPRFREGAYEAGILDGARAIVGLLNGTLEASRDPARSGGDESFAALIFWIVVIAILLNSLGGGRRRGRLGRALLAGSILSGGRGFPGGGGGGFGGRGGGFGGGGASGGW